MTPRILRPEDASASCAATPHVLDRPATYAKDTISTRKWAELAGDIPPRYEGQDQDGTGFFDPNQLPTKLAFAPAEKATGKGSAIARFGGVGDNLMAASVLPLLKAKWGRVDVFSEDPCAVIFENNPHIDRLVRPDKKPLTTVKPEDWQEWFQLRAKEYDFMANLSHSCETVGALFQTQTQFWWNDNARRRFCERSYIEIVHDVCDVPYEFGRVFYPTDEEMEKAQETKRAIGEQVIGWCIAGSRVDKIWPYASLAIARIIREFGIPVVLIGNGAKDFTIAKNIMEWTQIQLSKKFDEQTVGRMLHLALSPEAPPGEKPLPPTWPLRRSLSFAQVCDLIVSPDSGIAWSVGFEPTVPKVMMLSHASVKNICLHWKNVIALHAKQERVPCWPCHKLHDSTATCVKAPDDIPGSACISDISINDMVVAIGAALSRTLISPSDVQCGFESFARPLG